MPVKGLLFRYFIAGRRRNFEGACSMKFLITGGCGFIGTAFATHLLADSGHSIRVLDNLSGGSVADLEQVGAVTHLSAGDDFSDWSAPLALHVGDILDPVAIDRALTGADVVIHLAANTGVPQSVADPMQDCRTNVLGVLNMLEGCRAAGVGRFVFASSGAPLGVQIPPLNEEMAPRPASPYGASKLAGEGYCSAYYHCYGIETVALRFGNVYGEGSGKKGSVVAMVARRGISSISPTLSGRLTGHPLSRILAEKCSRSHRPVKPPSRKSPKPFWTSWKAKASPGPTSTTARPATAMWRGIFRIRPRRAGCWTGRRPSDLKTV